MNEKKTIIMVINISLNEDTLEQVNNFKYLGIKVDNKENEEIEINTRIQLMYTTISKIQSRGRRR